VLDGTRLAHGCCALVGALTPGCGERAIDEDPRFDLARLTTGVVFEDNGRNVDATAIGVPTPPGLPF
jgi:hypothetical protein